jgi:hypothetical protein
MSASQYLRWLPLTQAQQIQYARNVIYWAEVISNPRAFARRIRHGISDADVEIEQARAELAGSFLHRVALQRRGKLVLL